MGRYKWSIYEEALLGLLREIRQEAGLSGPQIQKALSRPNSYVAKVESGDKRLDILELYEYCNVCGIMLSEFSHRLEIKLTGLPAGFCNRAQACEVA